VSRKPAKERLTFLEDTSREFEIALAENPDALSYLHGRGLSTESIDRFRLGLVDDPPAEYAKMSGRLAIPYLKKVGVVGFKFRCIDPECVYREGGESHREHAKYVNYDRLSLFNVAALDNEMGFIALAEGEMDAMILDGECGIPAAGLPSAQSWKGNPHWRRLLKDFERVYMFADPDEPGQALARQIEEDLPQTVIIHMPELEVKSDVNNVFLRKGKEFLREQVGLAA